MSAAERDGAGSGHGGGGGGGEGYLAGGQLDVLEYGARGQCRAGKVEKDVLGVLLRIELLGSFSELGRREGKVRLDIALDLVVLGVSFVLTVGQPVNGLQQMRSSHRRQS